MIVDTIGNWRNYPFGPAWEKAFCFLESLSSEVDTGRHIIDGTDIFAEVAEYETVPEERKPYESHREYADVQFLLRGSEWLDYAPLGTLAVLQDYDPARGDYMLHTRAGAPATRITLGNGVFSVLYPEDAHAPGVAREGVPEPVKKVVVKIRLSLLKGR
jgi:YhcH/YjgK/YiaL family protein